MRRKKEKFNKINIIYILIFFIGIGLFFYDFFKQHKKIVKIENKKIEKNIISKTKKIKSIYKKFDLETDNSIKKFINNKISFNNPEYKPENLKNVRHIFIYSTKNNSATLRQEAQEQLKNLSLEFSKEFSADIKVISGYRSYKDQKRIEDSKACEDNLCAKAGHSEHQTGLAVDLFEASTKEEFMKNPDYKKYFKWLEENAYKYGFTNTYRKGKEIDGYDIEPWHWRYLGVELASYLKEKNMTFAEFYQKSKNFEKNKKNNLNINKK